MHNQHIYVSKNDLHVGHTEPIVGDIMTSFPNHLLSIHSCTTAISKNCQNIYFIFSFIVYKGTSEFSVKCYSSMSYWKLNLSINADQLVSLKRLSSGICLYLGSIHTIVIYAKKLIDLSK